MGDRLFTYEEAEQMRAMRETGATLADIGRAFHGITEQTVWDIVNGYTYKDYERCYRTAANIKGPMIAMPTECVKNHYGGQMFSTWLKRRGCDQRDINRISAGRKWAYGSFRPSDRAALMVDASPVLTPFAPEPTTIAAG